MNRESFDSERTSKRESRIIWLIVHCFLFSFFVHLIVFFAHLVVFLHISLSFAHLIVFCTSYCFLHILLFCTFLFHCTFYSYFSFSYHMYALVLCYLYNLYSYCFALSTERTWFDCISLLVMPCITIMWQIKKPWTLITGHQSAYHKSFDSERDFKALIANHLTQNGTSKQESWIIFDSERKQKQRKPESCTLCLSVSIMFAGWKRKTQ